MVRMPFQLRRVDPGRRGSWAGSPNSHCELFEFPLIATTIRGWFTSSLRQCSTEHGAVTSSPRLSPCLFFRQH
jgi:hypothetical protein